MSKDTSGGSKNLKPKIFGATPLQVGEDDVSRLIGGIVEKGFSQVPQTRPLAPPSAPRPTVLPFPAARHRSHGPHWAPKVGNSNLHNDDDNDNEDDHTGEEGDFDGMETAADVANPVQRKEKKGLDFSRWREIVEKDAKPAYHEKEKGGYSNGMEVGQKDKKMASNGLRRPIADRDGAKLQSVTMVDNASKIKEVKEETRDTSVLASAKEFHSFKHGKNENGVQTKQYQQDGIGESEGSTVVEEPSTRENEVRKEMDLKMQNMQKSYAASGFSAQKLGGGEKDSLQSEIDSENRARLADMSVDDIAEAQAEIMAKMNPELINALKKRGQAKAKRQKSSLTDVSGSASNGMGGEEALSKSSENTVSSPNVSPDKGGIWNAWSKRVERVRDMRFSIDGDIIGFGLESDIGLYDSNNVSRRDYLRTEGDPGAAGYTIKEAIALARSVVPGQRTLALSVISSILNRAIYSIIQNQVDVESADWVAIWAYALGPEPELALSLRISLDDNHNNVALTCAKTILSALSCDMNNILFDIWEKTPTYTRDVFTAPVFRSKPDVNVGFLRGGFWKYNTKPSNILRFGEELEDDNTEGGHTIQDDVVVAGQDFVAGLVRMGILERICYLLETDPAAPLEECLVSILVAIARHSPTCAAAVLDCERLVQTVAGRFASNDQMEINSCKIKSVTLFKALARHNRKSCSTFINNGILRRLTWHLYRYPLSIDQWVKSGRESCILSSALLVEQLRLWKVSIHYGYIISDFSDLFTSLCAWLSVPTFEKLIDNDVLNEYCAIVREAYLLLDVLANRLPSFYSHMHDRTEDATQDTETWSWGHFGPIIDLALEWIQVKNIPYVARLFNSQRNDGESLSLQGSEVNSLLWVISSVLSMLATVLESVIPGDIMSLPNGQLPWLPDFVPKTGLEIIKNGYFRFAGLSDTIRNIQPSENGSLVEYLCRLRLKEKPELAISSQCCLQGLIRVVNSVDKLVQHANLDIHTAQSRHDSFSRDDKILANGILKSCTVEKQYLLSTLTKAIIGDWQFLQPIEVFGRGGPAPGVGVGWGASGGGYWSLNTLLGQQDARLLVYLLEICAIPSPVDPSEDEAMDCTMQKLNCALTACLILGPGNSSVLDKLLKVVFQVPVLKCLDFGIHRFLRLGKGYGPFKWNYDDDEYLLFANVLASHFRSRWLGAKRKRKATFDISRDSQKSTKKNVRSLETIHEDTDAATEVGEESSSLILEWANQRLPLPAHWFLSAISTIPFDKKACPPGASYKETQMEVPSDVLEVAKSGLFFLLGIEAIPTFLGSNIYSPVNGVPVVWKLHAMSATLLSGMGVLEDEKSRDVYETLQNMYGEALDETTSLSTDELGSPGVESLKFKTDIHENYSTFIETLVEQFAAESYGDMIFGRQVAIYLHRSVEASVRLAAWNTLSNARVLELLPPLQKCLAKADGYLEPIEDNEGMLEAFAKSWVSGALDKAANRSSAAFSLALHHLSSFIFGNVAADATSLRNKLAKSLLRDYARKQQHEGLLVKLVCYKKPDTGSPPMSSETAASSEIEKRLQLLREICDGCAAQVQKLEACTIFRCFNLQLSMADWSTLPPELLHFISQHLPTSTDRLRFRSVCATWRAAVPPPLSSAGCFPILPNSGISDTSWGFFLSKRTVYSLQPPLPDHSSWIIKLDRDNAARMHLLHPLDRSQCKPLPNAFPRVFSFFNIRVRELGDEYALQCINFRPTANSIGEAGNLYMEKVAVLNNGGGRFVLLTIHVSGKLVVYKSGDEKWRLIDDLPSPYDDVILWGGRFYAVDNTGRIVCVNIEDLNVSVAANSIFGGDKKFLVDHDGELLLVDMYLSVEPAYDLGFAYEEFDPFDSFMSEKTVKFKVFRLDGDAEKWIEMTDLGDKILFLGDDCAFLASAAETFGDEKCKGNCILFTDHGGLKARGVGVFDLESGIIGPISKMFWPPPDWVYSTASIEDGLNRMNI